MNSGIFLFLSFSDTSDTIHSRFVFFPAKVSSSAAGGVKAGGVGGPTAGEVFVPFLRARAALFRGAAGLSLYKV